MTQPDPNRTSKDDIHRAPESGEKPEMPPENLLRRTPMPGQRPKANPDDASVAPESGDKPDAK